MFYTVASRIITTSTQNNLCVFLAGSICYIIIHWKLHSTHHVGIAEKIKNYLYYVMVGDIATAYILSKYYPKKSLVETPEHIRVTAQKLHDVRKMQQLRQQEIKEQYNSESKNESEKVSEKYVEHKQTEHKQTEHKQTEHKQIENIHTEPEQTKQDTPSIFVKKETKKDSVKDSSQTTPDDTDIPVFNNKKS
jgi:hypothetical protein